LRAYKDAYGVEYNIVRFFNVYGEGQRDDFVMSRFVNNVLNDTPPEVYGDGTQARCFCYVEDAARGMVEALFSGKEGEIFNIGNDSEPISMEELARKIIELSDKPLDIKRTPYSDSDRESHRDIMKRIPSIKKAEKILGYSPTVPLEKGLAKILRHFEQGREKEVVKTKA